MKKSDKKYRQGRSKDRQNKNEGIVTYAFIGILIMFLIFIFYNLSLSH